jgi:hypothetical protein
MRNGSSIGIASKEFVRVSTKGEADDDEAEASTVEQIEKTNPDALKPLPFDQGLAVSLKYEKGSQERKFKPTPRGEVTAKATASTASSSSSPQHKKQIKK